ncbi:MAG: hypothetical protein EPO32_11420 [Anaerolineae bacterium]|nr:MAG: hypothetical protein EPO32_11420 [Anaerolineae bacterium]
MPNVKTAISLPEKLFDESNDLAEQLEISRSRLIALALQEFLQRHHNRRALNDLNLALADLEDDEDDLGLLARAAERLKDVEW